ncbi:hypothetical protein B9Z55_002532 [Caenorhabditis nigoni]|uniref:Tyrosine-protein phosphatase domain-containing protein n=1 Tax=Caenorhabditis nigoni TaxID=1611254 RepID=A0A2G5VKW1_9PELO|nr:hypothetical protein B9Z55_002532 [Caenorhabditis nigoni]
MYRFNRKAKPDVPNRPKSNDSGSKNSRSSSGSSAPSSSSHYQKKGNQPKSESDSKSEKSLKPPPRRLVQPSPPPKQNSPNRKSVPKGVVHQTPLTPNKKQQKSTSTPPTSVRSADLKSDYLDSGLEKQTRKSKSGISLSNSLSGSTESMENVKPKQKGPVPAKMVKSERSLIGLDGESLNEYPRNTRNVVLEKKSSENQRSPRDSGMDESETKESVSLAEDEEQRETYRKLFKDLAMASQKMTLDDFKCEFSELPGDPPSDQCVAFNNGANSRKNRYYNIPCLDSSRVRLTFMAQKTNPSSDYIHANHIKSPFLKRGYILTQGPKKETIADFWRMVWQERSNAIVMLCQFVETNREKCCEYFPRNANSTLRFDKLTVTFEEATNNKMIVSTRLNLSFEGESRVITHLQWKEWPDYQVPGSSEVMLKILRKIRARTTPPIIHCAAGVGRSGTLVAIEIALQSINTHFKLPDIKQIVTNLRLTGRATSVQTLQQYMLIWKVLLDFGVSNKLISEDSVAKFASTYQCSLRSNS